jgi:hypothetical protein
VSNFLKYFRVYREAVSLTICELLFDADFDIVRAFFLGIG